MRVYLPQTVAALRSGTVSMVLLVEMDFDSPLYCNSTSMTLTIGGVDYLGVGQVGSLSDVQETPSEIRPLSFQLTGVPSSAVAMALGTLVQGRDIRIKLALFASDGTLLEVIPVWSGRGDTMVLLESGSRATITVTAEHAAIDLVRPSTSLYSHLEQQRLHPGDLAFQYLNDQAEMSVVWPAASWGKR